MKLKRIASVMLIGLAGTMAAQQAIPARDTLQAKADMSIPAYKPVPGISGHLSSFGADTMDDLMRAWIAGFITLNPQVSIQLQSKASLSVPASLTAGAANLAPLSREMNPSEIQSFQSRYGYPPTEIKVALGSYRTPTRTVALTFYVNQENPIRKLDFAQLDAMWCTTRRRGYPEEITRWGQLGLTGDWTNRPIHLVGVLPPDGVPNFINRTICQGGMFRDDIYQEKNGGPTSVLTRIVRDVAHDPDAIGYAGFRNIQPGTKQVLIAKNSTGPYMKGTFDEARQAHYPLTRYVYIYINSAPGEPIDPTLRQFLEYILSYQGQQIVEREGIFMPLPARIDREQLRKIR